MVFAGFGGLFGTEEGFCSPCLAGRRKRGVLSTILPRRQTQTRVLAPCLTVLAKSPLIQGMPAVYFPVSIWWSGYPLRYGEVSSWSGTRFATLKVDRSLVLVQMNVPDRRGGCTGPTWWMYRTRWWMYRTRGGNCASITLTLPDPALLAGQMRYPGEWSDNRVVTVWHQGRPGTRIRSR